MHRPAPARCAGPPTRSRRGRTRRSAAVRRAGRLTPSLAVARSETGCSTVLIPGWKSRSWSLLKSWVWSGLSGLRRTGSPEIDSPIARPTDAIVVITDPAERPSPSVAGRTVPARTVCPRRPVLRATGAPTGTRRGAPREARRDGHDRRRARPPVLHLLKALRAARRAWHRRHEEPRTQAFVHVATGASSGAGTAPPVTRGSPEQPGRMPGARAGRLDLARAA